MNSAAANRLRRPEHSEIKHKNMRFLITDRPTDTNVERYIEVNVDLIEEILCSHKPQWDQQRLLI